MTLVPVRSLFRNSINLLLAITFFSSLVLFTGCQKKTEQNQQQPVQSVDTTRNTKGTDTTNKTTEATKIDLKGKYSGTFDKRPTTLNIKEQDGNKFKGSITINYREVINQQVEGEFNPNSLEFSMKDLLHSRYQGKYKGKFDKDLSGMSGTFTMNLDGSKFNFDLKKK